MRRRDRNENRTARQLIDEAVYIGNVSRYIAPSPFESRAYNLAIPNDGCIARSLIDEAFYRVVVRN
jgi:hypothetical protein